MKNVLSRYGRIITTGSLFLVLCSLLLFPNAFASQYGTYLGQFNTVPAYSNGDPSYDSHVNYYAPDGTYIGLQYQCVEYVRLYYYTIFNLKLSNSFTGDARYWYANASSMGLQSYANATSTVAPQVGDILCSTLFSTGHISIIQNITNGHIYTAQQNFSEDSGDLGKQLNLSVSNGTYTISGYSGIQGWLRPQRNPGQSSATWHPDGTLLQDNSGTVWLIENGKKRGIPDDWTFASNELSWWRIIKASPQELSCFETDTNLAPPPTRRLLRRSDGVVFLITDRGFKRGFASMDVFNGLGYSWADVITNNVDSEIASHPDDPAEPVMTSPLPDGTLIQTANNPAVYVITNGKKQGLNLSVADFQNAGYGFDQVVQVSSDTFRNITEITPPLDSAAFNHCNLTISGTGGIDPNPTFTSTATASPNPASPNQSVDIPYSITNTTGAANDVIVDIEIYNSSNQRVYQTFEEHQSFSTNQTRNYGLVWLTPIEGQYTVKLAVFNSSWTVNYHWNDNALTLSIGGSSPPNSYQLSIWWPTDGATVSGTQPFKALLDNIPLSNYSMYWQVDGGGLVPMYDSTDGGPHKEAIVDLSGWTWRGTGPYTVNFVAKDANNNILAQRAVNITVVH